jgi:hypothetical protein
MGFFEHARLNDRMRADLLDSDGGADDERRKWHRW